MANETTTNQLSGAIGAQWEATLIIEKRESQVVLPFVDMGAQMVGTGTKYFPALSVTPALTSIANGASEANAQSLQVLSTTAASVSPNAKAMHILASWVSMAQSPVNWQVELPGILARANVDILETDAASLLSSFTSVAGTSGVKCRVQDLRQAIYKFRTVALSSAGLDAAFILHPFQVDNVDEEMQSGSGVSLTSLLMRSDIVDIYGTRPGSATLKAFRGGIMNVPIFTTTKVPDVGGSTGDHGGAIVKPGEALGGGWNWLGKVMTASQDVNRILGDSWQISSCYAFTKKVDTSGVTVQTDHV